MGGEEKEKQVAEEYSRFSFTKKRFGARLLESSQDIFYVPGNQFSISLVRRNRDARNL